MRFHHQTPALQAAKMGSETAVSEVVRFFIFIMNDEGKEKQGNVFGWDLLLNRFCAFEVEESDAISRE